jgi:threonine dehydrogenase-like Zn-dependent dehydrogenase
MAGVVTGSATRSLGLGRRRVVVEPGNEELGRIGGGGPEGGLTPELLVRQADAGLLHPVPDHVPLDVAAFAEPLAVGMHAVEQADVQPGDGVAVFGCGPSASPRRTLLDRVTSGWCDRPEPNP